MPLRAFSGRVTLDFWMVLESGVVVIPGHRFVMSHIFDDQKRITLLCESIVEPLIGNRFTLLAVQHSFFIEEWASCDVEMNDGLRTYSIHPIIFAEQFCRFTFLKFFQSIGCCLRLDCSFCWKINIVRYDFRLHTYIHFLPRFREERLIPVTVQVFDIPNIEPVELTVQKTASLPKQTKPIHAVCQGKCLIGQDSFVWFFFAIKFRILFLIPIDPQRRYCSVRLLNQEIRLESAITIFWRLDIRKGYSPKTPKRSRGAWFYLERFPGLLGDDILRTCI